MRLERTHLPNRSKYEFSWPSSAMNPDIGDSVQFNTLIVMYPERRRHILAVLSPGRMLDVFTQGCVTAAKTIRFPVFVSITDERTESPHSLLSHRLRQLTLEIAIVEIAALLGLRRHLDHDEGGSAAQTRYFPNL